MALLVSSPLRLRSGERPRDGAVAPAREYKESRDRQPNRDRPRRAHADQYAHHPNRDAHAYPVARSDAHAYPVARSDAHAHPVANSDAHAHPVADADRHTHTNPNSRAKPNAHSNGYAHAHRNANPDIDNRHAKRALGDGVSPGTERVAERCGYGVRRRSADVQVEKVLLAQSGTRLALH